MANVVFTGRGYQDGVHVERATWASQARSYGHHVQDEVDYSTEVLVASRSNTTKARAAQAHNVPVVTYEQWVGLQRMTGGDFMRRIRQIENPTNWQQAPTRGLEPSRAVPPARGASPLARALEQTFSPSDRGALGRAMTTPVAPNRPKKGPKEDKPPTSALGTTGRRILDLD